MGRHLCILLFLSLSLSPLLSNGANFVTDPLFTGQQYAARVYGARGLYVDEAGDVLVVARSLGQILGLWSTRDSNGTETVNRATILNAPASAINHGITYHKGYLYVSSDSTVYRYPYTPGQRTPITASATVVINGLPTGGHSTRTLVVDEGDLLYVSVGSNMNIDPNSSRARIIRVLVNNATNFPFSFTQAQVYADGLRNEVGLAFDKTGRLWGVENSGDNLNRPDLGGDIHNGNPAEELNRFGEAVGTFYGYPFCFSSYNLQGITAGTQFTWPSFLTDGVHNDNWCQNRSNNLPPALAMPAHQAPLGISFLTNATCDTGVPGSFPCSMEGDAFVAFHGSWNSDSPTGYRVVRIPFNKNTLLPTGDILNVIYEPNTGSCGAACFRPVNAVFNKDGHLIVSADASNEIFRVAYNATLPPVVFRT